MPNIKTGNRKASSLVRKSKTSIIPKVVNKQHKRATRSNTLISKNQDLSNTITLSKLLQQRKKSTGPSLGKRPTPKKIQISALVTSNVVTPKPARSIGKSKRSKPASVSKLSGMHSLTAVYEEFIVDAEQTEHTVDSSKPPSVKSVKAKADAKAIMKKAAKVDNLTAGIQISRKRAHKISADIEMTFDPSSEQNQLAQERLSTVSMDYSVDPKTFEVVVVNGEQSARKVSVDTAAKKGKLSKRQKKDEYIPKTSRSVSHFEDAIEADF